jgi:hypothetical protein
MDFSEETTGFVRNPLVWAADCCKLAVSETEPEARDAYTQLAEEFAGVWTEMEGLIGTFEALSTRKRND